MAKFALAGEESPSHGLHRTAEEEVKAAIEGLKRLPPMEAIHEFRRATKRLRALLRLGCPDRDEESAKLYNLFKTLASKASEARDISVRLRLLRKINGELTHPSQLIPCEHLEQRCVLQLQMLNVRTLRAELLTRLHVALRLLQNWPSSHPTRRDLKRALKNAETKASKAEKKARENPTTENLHRWRRRVKTECSMRHFLRKSLVHSNGAAARRLKKLTDLLGDDHDLALLDECVAQIRSRGKRPIRALIADKRCKLQKQIL